MSVYNRDGSAYGKRDVATLSQEDVVYVYEQAASTCVVCGRKLDETDRFDLLCDGCADEGWMDYEEEDQ